MLEAAGRAGGTQCWEPQRGLRGGRRRPGSGVREALRLPSTEVQTPTRLPGLSEIPAAA